MRYLFHRDCIFAGREVIYRQSPYKTLIYVVCIAEYFFSRLKSHWVLLNDAYEEEFTSIFFSIQCDEQGVFHKLTWLAWYVTLLSTGKISFGHLIIVLSYI